jgi:hypothetical protein
LHDVKLAPLRLEPQFVPRIWGARSLAPNGRISLSPSAKSG